MSLTVCETEMSRKFADLNRKRGHTASKIAMLANIAFAGGNGCRMMMIRSRYSELIIRMYYWNDNRANNAAIKERVQDVNYWPEGFHDLSIAFKSVEDLSLFLKNGGDGINIVASFKFLGEGMFGQIDFGLVFVLLKSRVEDALEGDE